MGLGVDGWEFVGDEVDGEDGVCHFLKTLVDFFQFFSGELVVVFGLFVEESEGAPVIGLVHDCLEEEWNLDEFAEHSELLDERESVEERRVECRLWSFLQFGVEQHLCASTDAVVIFLQCVVLVEESSWFLLCVGADTLYSDTATRGDEILREVLRCDFQSFGKYVIRLCRLWEWSN